LDRLLVFYPREKKYPLAERLDVIPLTHLAAVDLIAEF
jgi:hypothetical protein